MEESPVIELESLPPEIRASACPWVAMPRTKIFR